MNRDVVLIDTQHARIFRLDTGAAPEKLRFAHPNHHTHRQGHEDKESPQFYAEVAGHLRDADAILVIGHGVAKTHFQQFLEQHHDALTRYFHRVEATRLERGV
jgi:hypothetical protein